MKLRLPQALLFAVLAAASSSAYATAITTPTTITSFDGYVDENGNPVISFEGQSSGSSIVASGDATSNRDMLIKQTGGEVTVTGGEVTIGRYRGNDYANTNSVLNIAAGATLNIMGTDVGSDPRNDCALVLSHWAGNGTVNVNGTLNLRDATVSSHAGTGYLNINDGGILNVRGLNPYTSSGGSVTIALEQGGRMNIGGDGIANRDTLNLNLNGGTIGIDGTNGATEWESAKALTLSGNVTFDTAIQGGSGGTGTITLSSIDAGGNKLNAAGGGTLTVNSLTGSIGGISIDGVGTTITINLSENAYVSIRDLESAKPTANGYQTITIKDFVTATNGASLSNVNIQTSGNGKLTIAGVEATLNTDDGSLSTNEYVYAIATENATLSEILQSTPTAGSTTNTPHVYVFSGQGLILDNGGSIAASNTGNGELIGDNILMEDASTLYLTAGSSVNSAPRVTVGGSIIVDVAADATATWASDATVTTGNGIGTVNLNSGATLISGDIFSGAGESHSVNMSDGSTWQIADGATVNLENTTIHTTSDNASVIASTLNVNGAGANMNTDEGSTLTISSAVTIAAGQSLTKTGAGTVEITGAVYGENVNSTLNVADGVINLAADSVTLGTGKFLVKAGAGTMKISGALNAEGTVQVNEGQLMIGAGKDHTANTVNMQGGTMVVQGDLTITSLMDMSMGGEAQGSLVIESGTTTIGSSASLWLGTGGNGGSTGVSPSIQISHEGILNIKGFQITGKSQGKAATLTSKDDNNIGGGSGHATITVSNAALSGSPGTVTWKLEDSRLTNTGTGAMNHNGVSTNSDFINSTADGSIQMSTGTNTYVKLTGENASATGVTKADGSITAKTITTVNGKESLLRNDEGTGVTVTESLYVATLAVDAQFISEGAVTSLSDTGHRVLFSSTDGAAVQGSLKCEYNASLTMGDGATLTLGGALRTGGSPIMDITLAGSITLNFTSDVVSAISSEFSGTDVFDVLLATNVNSVTLGSTTLTAGLENGVSAGDYITMGNGLTLADDAKLVLQGNNLVLTGVMTPEPTTATLSLLALAALAARRRRKA